MDNEYILSPIVKEAIKRTIEEHGEHDAVKVSGEQVKNVIFKVTRCKEK